MGQPEPRLAHLPGYFNPTMLLRHPRARTYQDYGQISLITPLISGVKCRNHERSLEPSIPLPQHLREKHAIFTRFKAQKLFTALIQSNVKNLGGCYDQSGHFRSCNLADTVTTPWLGAASGSSSVSSTLAGLERRSLDY